MVHKSDGGPAPAPSSVAAPGAGPGALAGGGGALGPEGLDALRAARGVAAVREVRGVRVRVEVGVGELVAHRHPPGPDRGVATEQVDPGTNRH